MYKSIICCCFTLEQVHQGAYLVMSEKLCLKWNDFQENINSAFGSLRKDTDLSDVTLACADGQQIEAHKVVLSMSSPLFQNLLKGKRHKHPLIYMRGMKSEDLIAIVDFLYYGEANVCQENLDSFLDIAEELKLKGLTGQHVEEIGEAGILANTNPIQMKTKEVSNKKQSKLDTKPPGLVTNYDRRLAIPNDASRELQELDEQVKTMMELSQNKIESGKTRALICKVCGKEGERKSIRDHIEANHIEGISLPCHICGKISRSRQGLRKHKTYKH